MGEETPKNPTNTQISDAGASPDPFRAIEAKAREQALSLRTRIAKTIEKVFLPLLILTVACVVLLGWIIIGGTRGQNTTTAATMALASTVQVAFGMLIGYICVYIGLMMTWFGIEAAYSFEGNLSASETRGGVTLKSASPGLFFALGGMLLIAVSLYKPLYFRETALPYVEPIQHGPPPPFQDTGNPGC